MRKMRKVLWIIIFLISIIAPCRSAFAADSNNSFSQAKVISLNSMYTDNIETSSDEDYFKFTLTSAGYISISFSHDYVGSGLYYWKLCLYDEDKEELISRYYDGNTTGIKTTTNIGVPAGVYYIKVVRDYHSTVPYKVRLNYTSSSSWETEWNDSFNTPDAVKVNTFINGSIMESDDTDYYKIEVPTKGYISMSFSHDYVDSGLYYWKLCLYDENKEELISRYYDGNTTGTKTTTNIGVPAGVYYIKVVRDYHSTVPYKVRLNYTSSNSWETEWNDTFSSGDTLKVGSAVNGSVMESDDVDYYKIPIPSSAYYRLSFSHDYINSGLDYWKVYIYNSYNEEVMCYYYVGDVKSKTEEKIKLSKGTYYIKVVRSYHSDGKYNLKLSKYIAAPQMTSTKNIASGIHLSWKKASGASGYNVWRKEGNGSWEKVKTMTGTSWTDKNIINGTKYQYRVYSYNGNSTSGYRMSNVIYRLKRPVISSAKNSLSKKISVSWNKNTKATGYQVKYVKGSTPKTKKITSNKTTKYTISSLSKGKTYKVYVRAYKKVSGKTYYSAWSEAKSVKVKK